MKDKGKLVFRSFSLVKKIILGLKWDRVDDKRNNERNLNYLSFIVYRVADGFVDGSKMVGRFFKREV